MDSDREPQSLRPFDQLAEQMNAELRRMLAPEQRRKLVVEVPEHDFQASVERMRRHLIDQARVAGLSEAEAERKITTKLAALHCLRAAARLMPHIERQPDGQAAPGAIANTESESGDD